MAATLVIGGANSEGTGYALVRGGEIARRAGQRPAVIFPQHQSDDDVIHQAADLHGIDLNSWDLISVTKGLPEAISALLPSQVAVVDNLISWLRMLDADDFEMSYFIAAVIFAVKTSSATLLLVSEETIGEEYRELPVETRLFQHSSQLHRALSEICYETILLVGGRALMLNT